VRRGSYFSRIAGRTQAAPLLLPPRPIETLWKAARLDHPLPDADVPAPAPSRRIEAPVETTQAGTEHVDAPVAHKPSEPEPARPMQPTSNVVDLPVPSLKVARPQPRSASIDSAVPATEPPAVTPRAETPSVQKPPVETLQSPAWADRKHTPDVPQLRVPVIMRQEPAKAEPNQREGNSVHIGRIEVQVVSPQPAVRRVSPPAVKPRLARGYLFWQS
jgi:hypothetical protein